jgi:DNA-binding PucR family transcriptional regulator
VALAAGSAAPPVTTFAEVALLALMSGSLELLRAWVGETLGSLADDDDHNARLRDTLRVCLQENGSYKSTAERLVLHKNTVQYRVRKAEESMRRPSPRIGCAPSWRCWRRSGSARPCCGRSAGRPRAVR